MKKVANRKIAKRAVAHVSRKTSTAGELPAKVIVGDHRLFDEEPTMLTVSNKLTRNMGDYNSLSTSVSLTVPIRREDIDAEFQAVTDKVLELLEEELQEMLVFHRDI